MAIAYPSRPPVAPYPHVTKTQDARQYWINWFYIRGLAVVGLVVFTMITIALYFAGTQWWYVANNAWHGLIENSYQRHLVRYVWEGYNAGLGQQLLVYDHFKQPSLSRRLLRRLLTKVFGRFGRAWDPERLWPWDKLEIKAHLPNRKDGKALSMPQLLLALLILGPATALVVCFLAYHGVTRLDHVHWFHATTAWVAHLAPGPLADWQYFVIGFIGSRAGGRRYPRAVFADIHDRLALWFVEHHRVPPAWAPPNLRGHANWLQDAADNGWEFDAGLRKRNPWVPRILVTVTVLAVVAFAYGVYLKLKVIP